ncbi:MRE11 double-strand break endo/exonuclease [Gordonia phage TillyBobJoe]|uniref:MRE11 double-strand break endo/exonuclease n=1 Tax=Gordonia phage TillyBobJoe TaxID=2301560 RepID=A0A385DSB6_9CAUD|nr:MRE11 double-strand break endo/exonuclease [Gordonia phage TillyBobJoe]AXQ62284.1 MRE11 double-strand break endo/exonuclease [Gordonia phage TillyBobJoe]
MSGTTTERTGLRVIQLQAENFKRLKAVDITPDPESSTVTIAGRNAQGKSSVIDAIWAALANTAAAKGTGTTRPIRDGETSATVTVDLGGFIVTRTWNGDRTSLTVTSPDGAKYSSPQRMLDELIGRLSFDPLTFASLPAKQQQAELLSLVDLPFDPEELAGRRMAAFDERTAVGRQVKQLNGQLAGFLAFPVDTPTELVSVTGLLAELDAVNDRAAARERGERAVENRRALAAATERDITNLELQIADLKQQLDSKRAELDDDRKDVDAAVAALRDLPAVDESEAPAIRERIDNVESINVQVRSLQERNRVAAALDDADAHYRALTDQIARLDEERAQGLAAAEFPIDGLSFGEAGVTYQGVPFAQASAAEQLRVSVAIAMALNPKVRVIRVTDGSLLDSGNLALIDELAAANGYQVWIERVDDNAEHGVVIEDGQIAR